MKKYNKLRYLWLIILIIYGYVFSPLHWPSNNIKINQPNQFKISFQECGCPCPDVRIVKGNLLFNDSIKKVYPDMDEKSVEMNLVNFEPKNNVRNNYYDFDFLFSNDFKISGDVIGADTISCSSNVCELSPIFKVNEWELDSYYPRFWSLHPFISILLIFFLLIGLPILIAITYAFKKYF